MLTAMSHLFQLSGELCVVDVLEAARRHISMFEQLVIDILQLVHLLRVVRDCKAINHEVVVIGVIAVADEHLHEKSQRQRLARVAAWHD